MKMIFYIMVVPQAISIGIETKIGITNPTLRFHLSLFLFLPLTENTISKDGCFNLKKIYYDAIEFVCNAIDHFFHRKIHKFGRIIVESVKRRKQINFSLQYVHYRTLKVSQNDQKIMSI